MPQINEMSWLNTSIIVMLLIISIILSMNYQMLNSKNFKKMKLLNYFKLMK